MSKMGAPTKYTEELVDAICIDISNGSSLRAIAAKDGMPATWTMMRWLGDGKHEYFNVHYARAVEMRADLLVEDMLAIADAGENDTYIDEHGNKKTDHDVIARAKLRVDTRKWLASKFQPKKYGDRQAVEVSGAEGGPVEISLQDKSARLAGLMALAAARKAQADEA